MNLTKLLQQATPKDVSEKTWRFIEESDADVLDGLFGKCKTFAEMDEVAEELYDELFGVANDDNI